MTFQENERKISTFLAHFVKRPFSNLNCVQTILESMVFLFYKCRYFVYFIPLASSSHPSLIIVDLVGSVRRAPRTGEVLFFCGFSGKIFGAKQDKLFTIRLLCMVLKFLKLRIFLINTIKLLSDLCDAVHDLKGRNN